MLVYLTGNELMLNKFDIDRDAETFKDDPAFRKSVVSLPYTAYMPNEVFLKKGRVLITNDPNLKFQTLEIYDFNTIGRPQPSCISTVISNSEYSYNIDNILKL